MPWVARVASRSARARDGEFFLVEIADNGGGIPYSV
jgi:hypothetical protein